MANDLLSDGPQTYDASSIEVLEPLEAASNKLNTVLDNTEVQAAKQRQALEAALRTRNEPGGVVVTTVTDVMGFLAFLGLGTWILIGVPA